MYSRWIEFGTRISKGIEIILLPFSLIVGAYMKYFTKIPPQLFPISYKLFSKCNWLPVRFHYYQPIIKKEMLPKSYNKIENPLTGLDLDIKSQLDLLSRFRYNDELKKISFEKKDDVEPYYNNLYYPSGDAELLYNMVRFYKPKRIIEIGSGESTKFVRKAIKMNKMEKVTEHICIEPYERPWLEKLDTKIIRKPVEEFDVSFFKQLSENDILFIDSSHVIRTQGDVVFEYLQVIPVLQKGVLVHIHDIYLPREYPLIEIDENKRFWNEQYILQALLSHSKRYKILLAGYFLTINYTSNLEKCCPILKMKKKGCCSFWFKVL